MDLYVTRYETVYVHGYLLHRATCEMHAVEQAAAELKDTTAYGKIYLSDLFCFKIEDEKEDFYRDKFARFNTRLTTGCPRPNNNGLTEDNRGG